VKGLQTSIREQWERVQVKGIIKEAEEHVKEAEEEPRKQVLQSSNC